QILFSLHVSFLGVCVPYYRIDQKETFVLDSRVEGFDVLQPLYRLFVKPGVLSFAYQVIQRYLKCIGNFLGGINGRNSFAPFVFTDHYTDTQLLLAKLVCDQFLESLKVAIILPVPIPDKIQLHSVMLVYGKFK